MRHFSFFILLLVFVSCKNKPTPVINYTGFVDRQVVLDSGLGTVSFKLPARFDTFYKWIDWSDCFPCGWTYYKFANKKYALLKDDYRFKVEDSAFQLTIRHKYYKEIPDSFYANTKYVFDTIRSDIGLRRELHHDSLVQFEHPLINNRRYLVSFYRQGVSEINKFGNRLYANAKTIFNQRYLEFIFQSDASDTAEFFSKAYKTIQSIQIKE